MNTNLLDLNNDILNIIGDYVKEDNLTSEMKRNLLEYYISSYLSYNDENDIYISIDEINDKNYYKLLKQSDYTEDEIEDIIFKRDKFIGSYKNYYASLKQSVEEEIERKKYSSIDSDDDEDIIRPGDHSN
jgi:hypothetical protein